MDYLANQPRFNTLSLPDLLRARDQFHAHLLHKANVIGTGIGRYLIRKTDPYPGGPEPPAPIGPKPKKPPRTIENSEVRDYSWPAILVFVSKWVDEEEFGSANEFALADFVPRQIYLDDGRSVPVCTVLAPVVEEAPEPISPADLDLTSSQLAGGYPVLTRVQGAEHFGTIGCLLTDGHKIYGLTSRHVTGEPSETLMTRAGGKELFVGTSSAKQLGRMPFERLYENWPGKHLYVNLDVGLFELSDQTKWSPSVYGIGRLGPLADLSVYNLSLNLIGCPVRAFGCASGRRLLGAIAALFYRYKSVGGLEYVADFLIGSRDDEPLLTQPGDSGMIWVIESDDVQRDLMPVAVQWGGTVFAGEAAQLPFALATNLSSVCRELEVDLFRARRLAMFEYWGAVGHYTIGSLACDQVSNSRLKTLMVKNRVRISFEISKITPAIDKVTVPGFVPLADVPDKVWKKPHATATPYGRRGLENPNHYADMDFKPAGGKSLDELTPTAAALQPATWRQYYKSVGWNAVSQRGLLPFRVWQIYQRMVDFVAARDVANYVAAAGILAHYVGDACQPLHTSYLDDGDPFRKPDGTPSDQMLGHGKGFAHGVHVAFEDDMLDAKYDVILKALVKKLGASHGMKLAKNGQEAGFAVLELARRCRKKLPPKSIVDAYGDLVLTGKKSQATAVLWSKFGTRTVDVIADGCRTLAMLWESAWVAGGGDQIAPSKLTAISEKRLQEIYEKTDFLPSKALGQIDAFL